jgi:hypothetical protein
VRIEKLGKVLERKARGDYLVSLQHLVLVSCVAAEHECCSSRVEVAAASNYLQLDEACGGSSSSLVSWRGGVVEGMSGRERVRWKRKLVGWLVWEWTCDRGMRVQSGVGGLVDGWRFGPAVVSATAYWQCAT